MDTHQGSDDAHPDELLAGYVDGSATKEDRGAVDAHLATCERCRQEVDQAGAARAVLASLPELAAPGLAAAGVEAFREAAGAGAAAGTAPDTSPRVATPMARVRRPRRRFQWDRVALGAGLAAAAGLFIFFAATTLTKHSPSATSAAKGAQGVPSVIQRDASYSPASLQALADQLRGPATRHETVSRPAPGAFPGYASATPGPTRAADQASVISCLRGASGVDQSINPFYLEAASFQGTPAFIGAFVIPPAASGGNSHLLVVAASQNGCQPLYVVRQSI